MKNRIMTIIFASVCISNMGCIGAGTHDTVYNAHGAEFYSEHYDSNGVVTHSKVTVNMTPDCDVCKASHPPEDTKACELQCSTAAGTALVGGGQLIYPSGSLSAAKMAGYGAMPADMGQPVTNVTGAATNDGKKKPHEESAGFKAMKIHCAEMKASKTPSPECDKFNADINNK